MSIIGKKIIVEGASWGDIAISNLKYSIETTTLIKSTTVNLNVWFDDDVVDNNTTVSSSDTDVATVGTRSGSGTVAAPFVYSILGKDEGTTNIVISTSSTSKSFEMTVEKQNIPAGYTEYRAINAPVGTFCDVTDIQLSPEYSYEFNVRKATAAGDNMAFFGVRGYYSGQTFSSSGKAFALFANKTAGTPAGAKVGYWWNNADSDPIFNALPTENEMYVITVTPRQGGAIFHSTYNDTTLSVNNGASGVTEWGTGFAFFSYRYSSDGQHGGLSGGISLGTTIITNSNNEVIYKFIPVQNNVGDFGFYELITQKFYQMNSNNGVIGELE